MKLILTAEVEDLGYAGDVVDVKPGYGRNYLLPRGLAIPATKGSMKEAEALTRSRRAREAKTLDGARAAKEALEARVLRIEARVDDRGRLYGSVGAADVHRVLRERGHDVDRRRVDLRGGIKQVGRYQVPVRVHPQVVAQVTVEVVDAQGDERAAEEARVAEERRIADAALAAAAALEAGEAGDASGAGEAADAGAAEAAEAAPDGVAPTA
ncbi:MAG: 50S ribosomal protein L9 [Nitriliruptoraceae bacterium]